MPELLLELFSEEIPARMQAGAARDLERMAREHLNQAGFADITISLYYGPRRLTLVVNDLPAAQEDRSEEIKGPREGAPPQALEGFLRKNNLTEKDVTKRDGIYYATVSSKGRPTAEIIADMVDAIVRDFPWPKSMKWGTGTLRWVRPLKRILCLFGGKVVAFDIDGIKSGNATEGHRFMGDSRSAFAVEDFASYVAALKDHHVILDAAVRRARILDGAKAACAVKGLELVEDEVLLDEVTGLAEWPVPILGDMDPSFLDLPPEVIRTSMRTHQKYFAVRDPKTGNLAPHFVVVANIAAPDGGKALAAGNARVLSARLNDARFFWDEDRKVGFEPWLEKLKGVTFHAKLGTMAQRVERITSLAQRIAPRVGANVASTAEAARLAKADLVSGMVGEFPELQGLMGGYYSRANGAEDQIAEAIRDHYKPQGPSDDLPTAPVSIAVALADKLDMLTSFFAINEKPTGSKDPFALRRAALGIVRICRTNNVRLPILALVDQHQTGKIGQISNASFDVWEFLADRLTFTLKGEGLDPQVVPAVKRGGSDDLLELAEKAIILDTALKTPDGANLLAAFKRAGSLLDTEQKKGSLPIGPAIILPTSAAEEVALIAAVSGAEPKVIEAMSEGDFAAAMALVATLRKPLDAFFEKVLVNSDVPQERANRLKLLGQVRDLMGRVADFSLISG